MGLKLGGKRSGHDPGPQRGDRFDRMGPWWNRRGGEGVRACWTALDPVHKVCPITVRRIRQAMTAHGSER